MKTIVFLENTKFDYSIDDINTTKLRAAEKIIVNLCINISSMGHKVYLFNNCSKKYLSKNFTWDHINNIKNYDFNAHFTISNNDTTLFDFFPGGKKFLISHSIQTIEKFIRKRQFFHYFKHKPKVFLLGKYHNSNRNFFTKIYGYSLVSWAVDDLFINFDLKNINTSNYIFFNSRQDRGLDIALDVWKQKVYKKNISKKFLITPGNFHAEDKSHNVFYRKFSNTDLYANELSKARAVLLPGHKAELFCVAAEEAKELCIPIVTLGIGSLSDRVSHGINGLIAKNNDELGDYVNDILNDESLFLELRKNLLNSRGNLNWKKATNKFIEELK